MISYEGESAKELLDDFYGAIDDYLERCKAEGKEPEVAFKGSFNIRLSPDLHKKLFIYTTAHQMSMNNSGRFSSSKSDHINFFYSVTMTLGEHGVSISGKKVIAHWRTV